MGAAFEIRTLFLVGLVAFADAGWVGEKDADLGAPLRSLGLGLRLGSSEIYGANVFRIDLAFPLDDRGGLDYGPLLSASMGQVFGFFGNDRVLSRRLTCPIVRIRCCPHPMLSPPILHPTDPGFR